MALLASFQVYGTARPQGSTKSIARPVMDKATGQPQRDANGRVMMRTSITHSNRDSLMQWRADIRAGVQLHAPQFKDALVKGPVAVRAIFYMLKPTSVAKRRVFPIVAPDLDKLCRSVGDAFETVIIKNDSQIVHWDIWKVYTDQQAKVVFEIWEPDALQQRPASVNPFDQLGLQF